MAKSPPSKHPYCDFLFEYTEEIINPQYEPQLNKLTKIETIHLGCCIKQEDIQLCVPEVVNAYKKLMELQLVYITQDDNFLPHPKIFLKEDYNKTNA